MKIFPKLTYIEILTIFAIIGLLVAMLLPAIQSDCTPRATTRDLYDLIDYRKQGDNRMKIREYLVEKHERKFEYWNRNAEKGHRAGQVLLGLCYFHGVGVPEDKAKAVEWFRKAAEQEDVWKLAEAEYQLGYCYSHGYGVLQDEAESIKWYRKAAEQGHEEAIELLRKIEEENESREHNEVERPD
jgi:TPR repeat protein